MKCSHDEFYHALPFSSFMGGRGGAWGHGYSNPSGREGGGGEPGDTANRIPLCSVVAAQVAIFPSPCPPQRDIKTMTVGLYL